VCIGGDCGQPDTARVTITPPPAPDVRIEKEVAEGTYGSGNPFVEELVIDDLETAWVTYRIVTYNPGTLGQIIDLVDTVDFRGTDSVYDRLVVRDRTGAQKAVYESSYTGSTILLADNVTVPAGTSSTSTCANCVFYIEARIRTNFETGSEAHTNWARALDANMDIIVEDDATVRVDLEEATLTIIKEVKIHDQSEWQDIGLVHVDPANDSPIQYRITVTNTGDLQSGSVDIVDQADLGTAVIYETITDNTDGRNDVYPGSAYDIYLAQGIRLNGGQSRVFYLDGDIASAFAMDNPEHCNTAYIYEHNTDSELGQDDACVQVDAEGELTVRKSVRNVSAGGSFVLAPAGSPLMAAPGQVVEYRIEVENIGLVGYQNVLVNDLLDSASTYHSSVYMVNRDYDGNMQYYTGSWDSALMGVIAAGTTESYTFRAVIAKPFPAEDTVITNTAYANGQPSNTTHVLVNVTPRPNLAKQVSRDGVHFYDSLVANPGDTLTYRVMVWNSGDGYTPVLMISDLLDTEDYSAYGQNLDLDADANGRSFSGSTYDALSIQVPGNTSRTSGAEAFTFEATLNSTGFSEGETTENTAAMSYEQNEYEDTTIVTIHIPAARLVESKSAYNDTQNANAESVTADPGDVITYTLSVTNSGDADQINYTFSDDDISDILMYASITSISNGGSVSGDAIIWPVISVIEPGDTITRTFTITVDDPLAETGDFIMENFFGNLVQVPVGEIVLSKEVRFLDGAPVDRAVREGESVRYTITATNNGPEAISSFVFQDDVADILEYGTVVSISHAGSLNGQVIEWPATTLPVGQSVSRSFTVTVDDDDTWPVDGDFTMTNIYGDEINVDVYHSEVVVAKTLTTDPVTAVNQNVQFRIDLTNDGEVPLFNIRLADIWTTELLDYTGVTGISTPTAIIETNGARTSWLNPAYTINPAGVLEWDWNRITTDMPDMCDDPRTTGVDAIPCLAQDSTMSFYVNYVATDVGQAYNEMHAWADDYLPYTVVEGGDDATVIIGEAVITINKTASPTSVREDASAAERTITYTLTVSNSGDYAAHGLQVEDLLPQGFTYADSARVNGASEEPAQGTQDGRTVINWENLSVAAGGDLVITYRAVAPAAAGTYVNLAIVSDDADNPLDSDEATVTVTEVTSNPLTITKSVSPTVAEPGSIVRYTVTITNISAASLSAVELTDTLPAGFSYQGGATVGGVASEPSYSAAANPQVLVWNNLSVAAGRSLTVEYLVRTATERGRYYTNVAVAEVGDFSAQASATVYIPTIAGPVPPQPVSPAPFVSVLSTTGNDTAVLAIALSLVVAAYVLSVLKRRKFE